MEAAGQGYSRRSNLFEVALLFLLPAQQFLFSGGVAAGSLNSSQSDPSRQIDSVEVIFWNICITLLHFKRLDVVCVFHSAYSPDPCRMTLKQSWARLLIREVVPVRTSNLVQFTHGITTPIKCPHPVAEAAAVCVLSY